MAALFSVKIIKTWVLSTLNLLWFQIIVCYLVIPLKYSLIYVFSCGTSDLNLTSKR